MHSRYRISNSSDAFNLEVGTPSIQRLTSDKNYDEVRIYCEPALECQRIKNINDERLSSTTETLLVEPYFFNLAFSPFSENLSQEKKRKLRQENGENNIKESTKDPVKPKEESKPVSASKLERLKNLERRSSKENTNSEKKKKESSTATGKRPSDLISGSGKLPPSAAAAAKSAAARLNNQIAHQGSSPLPKLPTAPIPASQLPPHSVMRMPPPPTAAVAASKVGLPPSAIPAALSSLTPIPLKDLNKGSPSALGQQQIGRSSAASASPSVSANAGSISIQVPLQGADGSTIMQTINVPKSVLAGASERPVLLTVTPKNGANKGQKQIVMLTKNASGFGASMRTLPLGESPSKIMLTQRGGGGGSTTSTLPTTTTTNTTSTPMSGVVGGNTAANSGIMPQQLLPPPSLPSGSSNNIQPVVNSPLSSGSPVKSGTVTDIKTLLAQVKPVPTSELAGKVMTNSTKTTVIGGGASQQSRTLLIQQPQGQPGATSGQASGTRPVVQRQVIQQLIRPGQIISGGQQIVLQDGKRVILQQAVPRTSDQMPSNRIILTQKGQVQGAQAQALAGKIINTSQGQFIVASNGELLSTQKLIQNHLSNNQSVRYVAISSSSSGATTTQALMSTPSTVSTSASSSQQQPGRVTVAIPILQSANQTQLQSLGKPIQLGQGVPGVVGASPGPSPVKVISSGSGPLPTILGTAPQGGTTVVLNALPGSSGTAVPSGSGVSQASSGVRNLSASSIGGSPGLPPGGTNMLRPTAPGGQAAVSPSGTRLPTIGGGVGGATPSPKSGAGGSNTTSAFNQMFLNALSNRGLLTQQNGKFVYVGDKTKSTMQQGQSSVVASSSVVTIPVTKVVTTPTQLNPNSRGVGGNSLGGPLPLPVMTASAPGAGVANNPVGAAVNLKSPVQQGLQSPATSAADKSIVQVVVSVPNMESFTASPRLLRMASSLMENPTIAELINTPCENSDATTQNLKNGDNINIYGVKPLDSNTTISTQPAAAKVARNLCDNNPSTANNKQYISSPAVLPSASQTYYTSSAKSKAAVKPGVFYYRDPKLPAGWYVSVDTVNSRPPHLQSNGLAATLTPPHINYFTANGEKLRTLSEVAHYLANKLVLLPSCKAIRPPRPVAEMPLLNELSADQRRFVTEELVVPIIDKNGPVIRQIETEFISASPQGATFSPGGALSASPGMKRPGPGGGDSAGDQKKSKIVFY